MLHIARGKKLPLLDVDSLPGGGGGEEDVGLAAEKGRNLKEIAYGTSGRGLLGEVHIAGDRQPCFTPDAVEDRQTVLDAGPSKGRAARAVGLVVRGFEDDLDRQPTGQLRKS